MINVILDIVIKEKNSRGIRNFQENGCFQYNRYIVTNKDYEHCNGSATLLTHATGQLDI